MYPTYSTIHCVVIITYIYNQRGSTSPASDVH
jgi:hypothetical protein